MRVVFVSYGYKNLVHNVIYLSFVVRDVCIL